MDVEESQDVYTCGVCLQKINFQDLTNHVFLHDEYSAFSYDEATKIIEPITEAVKNNMVVNVQVEQPSEDQAYNLASTASALVDLGASTDQAADQASILYEQQVVQQQADITSSIISLPTTEVINTPIVSMPNLTQRPMSFIGADSQIDGINQSPNIVSIQTHPSDTRKVNYVAIQKPMKSTYVTKFDRPIQPSTSKSTETYLNSSVNAKPTPNLSTLNEIFVWNKGRDLIPGEVVTKVQVPIIENGASKMTECSIVFNRFLTTEKADMSKSVKTQFTENNDRFEEVQSVDGLDDMDFEVYMNNTTGAAQTVVTYKKKKPRRPGVSMGRGSKVGRQMDNYKWRETQVTDNVAKQLRKSILPSMVKGSPAVAKYLQAMNIPVDELDADLLQQQTEKDTQTQEKDDEGTVIELATDTAEADEQTVIIQGTEDEANHNIQAIVSDAMNALVEASEILENGDQNEEVEEGKGMVINPEQEEENMEQQSASDTKDAVVIEAGDDGSRDESRANDDDETESAEVVTKLPDAVNSGSNNCISDFRKDLNKFVEDVATEVKDALRGHTDVGDGDASGKIKEDGTADEATDGESGKAGEAHVATPYVRKSNRLQIKKESPVVGKVVKGVVVSTGDNQSFSEDDAPPPEEITSPGKKFGYFCSLCDCKLPPDTVLKDHLESHRVTKRKRPGTSDGTESVVEISTQPNKVFLYYCSLCNKMYPSEEELKEHCRQHKLEKTEEADDMDDSDVEFQEDDEFPKSSKKAKTLFKKAAPRVSKRKNSRHECDICGRVTTSLSGMYQHKKSHEDKAKDLTHHRCPLGCGQRFRTEMEVDLHGPFCLRNSDNPDTSKRREKEDDTDEDLTCPHCQRQCESKANLRYHSLVCRERPFEKCTQCDFTCKGILPMSRHQVAAHNMKPFKCEICDKTFKLKGSLRDHNAANHSEDKFVCEHCGKKFPKNNIYKRHVFVQHGGFRYPCNYCSKKFKDKRCWRIHENSHKGAYEYSCLPCKRSFSKAPDYKTHMKELHNIDGKEALDLNRAAKELRDKLCRISCPICKEKFPLETAFIHHLQTKHEFSYDEAICQYQKISGLDDTSIDVEFELQKGYVLESTDND